MSARDKGDHWEEAALTHALHAGLVLVARNFHCRFGEIDLILRDGECVVFAEVRYRGEHARGDGTSSVGAAKRHKLVRAAQTWLQRNPRAADGPCRFDVIGCSGSPTQPRFDWTRNAFDAPYDEIP
ncbi:MAG: YraN family protein [Rudaea sp.]